MELKKEMVNNVSHSLLIQKRMLDQEESLQ